MKYILISSKKQYNINFVTFKNQGSMMKSINADLQEIHIWSIDLNNYICQSENLYNILIDDECERANALTHKEDKSFFVVTKGIVRKILSLYTNIMPHCIKFAYNDCGKPYVSNQKDASNLYFNISHSENFALCIIAWDREVGIDIEKIRYLDNYKSIARQFFSSEEYLNLTSLPPKSQIKAFFKYWTRKEAFIKATGRGLSYPLNKFTVSLKPNEPAVLYKLNESIQKPINWVSYEIVLHKEYAAAFATHGVCNKIKYVFL